MIRAIFGVVVLLVLQYMVVDAFSARSPILGGLTRLRLIMNESFSSKDEYDAFLESQAALPRGFAVGAAPLTFVPTENKAMPPLPMTLTVIMADAPTASFAAMFTQNQFPGGPILVGRKRMAESDMMQVCVINNKISNVCPGGVADRGVGDSLKVSEAAADILGVDVSSVLPSSTGIIGWRLPVTELVAAVPSVKKALQSASILPAAKGICTTDRFPKVRRFDGSSCDGSSKPYSIVGIAKGAGMIEPNMATMLSYILTDAEISRADLDAALKEAVRSSFNTISIDGDQSTSDTVFIMSSNKTPGVDLDEFTAALTDVCRGLALDIVRNGEGTQHVIRINVSGAPSELFARDLGRFVANGALFKCAIAGSDPNVGRIVGGIGSFLSNPACGLSAEDVERLVEGMIIKLGGVEIFSNGEFRLDTEKEKFLSDYMHEASLYPKDTPEEECNFPMNDRTVDLDVILSGALGTASCTTIGSDLTKAYVEINSDYRS